MWLQNLDKNICKKLCKSLFKGFSYITDDEPDFELEWNEKSKHFIDGSSRNHPPPVTARHSIER